MAQNPNLTLSGLNEAIRVLELEGRAILASAERLRNRPEAGAQLTQALSLLNRSLNQGGKIVVTGVGKSGKIAQKIAATFASTGSASIYLHPTEALHGDLGVVAPNDSILALSYTGNTDELLRLIPSLKRLQLSLIGMGGYPHSQLAQACDVWIDASVDQEACPHNLAPTSSTTLALALGDALAMSLMQLRGFDAQSFAKNHPGGALGRRLHLTVADVMHSGDAAACVPPHALMEEVVVVSTQKKLGAVLVVEGSKLMGLITDGDLRRALQHREKFFQLRASDVMTRNPVSVQPDLMAYDALQTMENRPSQISVLPVLSSDGNWLGVVRLHDLIRSL